MSGSSLCARLHFCSADVLCHCIIYCRPLLAHPVRVVQVRVQLFGLTHHWEGPQTWLHISRPHMWQTQLEGNMQLPQSPLSHVARQGQFVNEAPVVSLSLDRDLQVPLSLPPSQELACGVGCPEAPGRPGRGRCMARADTGFNNQKQTPCLWPLHASFLLWKGYIKYLLLAGSSAQKYCIKETMQKGFDWVFNLFFFSFSTSGPL